jgi:D-alanine-D-alanine ligase
MKVAVLCGGNSAEREISRRSGRNVFAALKRKGWDVTCSKSSLLMGFLSGSSPIPRCSIFSMAAWVRMERSSSFWSSWERPTWALAPLASALAMDKVEAKKAFQGKNLPTPPWALYQGGDAQGFLAQAKELGFPLVLKPRREGSSVGVRIIRDEVELWEISRK